MFCGNCGNFVPDHNHFCAKCGVPLSQNFSMARKDDYAKIDSKGKNIDYTNHGELSLLFERTRDKLILIDLGGVDFIDSVGIGGLVTLVYKTNRTKQEIKFIIKSQHIMTAIKALGVDNVLEIYESEEEARASWGLPPN
jgi:anti-anti-sigma factor